jgi:translation initiation factor 6
MKRKVKAIEKELKASPIPVYLVETLITSPFIIANSNGVVIPNIFEKYALDALSKSLMEIDINLGVVESKYTALGNIVLANDHGAIVSPVVSHKIRKTISDVLDVEVASTTIGRCSYVGSLAAVNNKYGIVSPSIKEDEKSLIEDILDIKIYSGTVNGGIELPSIGLIVNDNGIVVGEDSDGRELMLISTVFESERI